ncbi:NAD-dependent epimerase/dehydratase family protein [Actinosynnema mirum]|uniref:NAD-dependent epimerase/dehydratase n=2 Tax=Actinosynnema TaxID=40566 RepID=C6WDY2_ACTMD|nr:NAD-dependent epimerase/dehydratase [Actinosynnema mirum DSM 43827]
MSPMRVLVTGARGYVGRAVAAELSGAGCEVVPLGCDVRSPEARDAARSVDAVVHLAALARVRESFERPLDYFDVNVAGTANLLRAEPARFVLASTAGVYGAPGVPVLSEDVPRAPASPYAASKAAAEDLVRWAAPGGVVLRLFNVAGGGDRDDTRIVTRACAAASGRLGPLAVYGDGGAVRDFVHVRDAARAFLVALGLDGGVFNVGATAASVADVVAAVEQVAGRPPAVEHHPAHPGEVRELRSDSARLRAAGWAPERSGLVELVRDQWLSESAAGSR